MTNINPMSEQLKPLAIAISTLFKIIGIRKAFIAASDEATFNALVKENQKLTEIYEGGLFERDTIAADWPQLYETLWKDLADWEVFRAAICVSLTDGIIKVCEEIENGMPDDPDFRILIGFKMENQEGGAQEAMLRQMMKGQGGNPALN